MSKSLLHSEPKSAVRAMGPAPSANETPSDTATVPNAAGRNPALDYTKGVLVLLMVLYHWTNYFISPRGDFYMYLRFITPSFIFITGFLIANVYLSKYRVDDFQLHKRLVQRGLKLLALFTALNLVWEFSRGGINGMAGFFDHAAATYLSGNGKTAAFSILVPISYVLLFSSPFVLLCKVHRLALAIASLLLFGGIFAMGRAGLASGNLELFAIGFLGMALGRTPIATVNRFASRPLILALAYAGYIAALNIWHERYAVQIVGVCLSLLVIYLLGLKAEQNGWPRSKVILLGKYSLFAYIAQIGIVLVLLAVFRRLNLDPMMTLPLSFIASFGLTQAAVEIVHWMRARSKTVDSVYRVVFA